MKAYLLFGVPGSGKTWVATQLKAKFNYIEHDTFPSLTSLVRTAAKSPRDIVVTCPFKERELRDMLIRAGLTVIPIAIVEIAEVVAKRYLAREGRPLHQSSITRCATIMNRVNEWQCQYGTSTQVLKLMESI
jgi:gluconate kinase